MSSPIITLTSLSNTSNSRTSPYNNSKIFGDPSFSSYLNGAEEAFVLQLRGAIAHGLNSSVAVPHAHIFLGEHKTEDTEIDVFDAERYFNETFDSEIAYQLNNEDPAEIQLATKEQPQTATPSIHSESSWNRWNALLQKVSRNQQPRRTNKKNFLASIGCGCSRIDKNSVSIDSFNGNKCFGKSNHTRLDNGRRSTRDKSSNDLVNNSKLKYDETVTRVHTDGHFSFPVFNTKTGNQAASVQLQEEDNVMKQKSGQESGFSILESGKHCLSLEKELTFVTSDAIAPGAAEETISHSISTEVHNDSNSDASSDLFEIERLSKGSVQVSDGMSNCLTPRACYAPSEASIEWSVITASAADFSVLSDSEELTSNAPTTMPQLPKKGSNSKIGPFKEMPIWRSRILSGCKNHTAVDVARDAHKAYDEKGFSDARRPPKLESFPPMTRFHGKDKLAHFDARKRQCVLLKPHQGSSSIAHLFNT